MKEQIKTKQTLREQSAWLLAAKVIGFAFSFALPLMVVRFLSQDEVGHYRQAFQVVLNAVIILPLGVSMSSYYFLTRESDGRRGAAILNILIFNFVVGGLACLFLYLYPQSLGNIFKSEELTNLAPKIGVVIWIWIFSTFLETVAVANQEARVATVFIIAAQFSKAVLMGTAVMVFATVEAFISAAMIQGVIQTFILIKYLQSRFPGFWREFDPRFFREQMIYAIPFGLATIVWIAQTDIHNYFVGYKFSSADFAVYAYGCFEVPLIAMLSESVTSVLIPRMNTLQQAGDQNEMIRLTSRAMQKLSFFYFPIYAFLLVTAHTFIITLFTEKYEVSASVFVINITLLPFSILITDPIVRAYKELGRLFLLVRILVLIALVGVLYYGLTYFGMTGMITTAVGAVIFEKIIAEVIIIRKLGLKWHHLSLMKNTAKTAIISAMAGIITYFVYTNAHDYLFVLGGQIANQIFPANAGAVHFASGSFVLLVCGLVFAPVYLLAANFWGVIEDEEKNAVRNILRKVIPRRVEREIVENQV